jgi:hypothetical protein
MYNATGIRGIKKAKKPATYMNMGIIGHENH